MLTFATKAGAHPVFPENNSFLIRDEQARPQHFAYSTIFSFAWHKK